MRAVRKIIHVDMDAFYASVEQHDRPELRGRPLIVGGDPRGRGVVASCSYEARRFGVRSAMPAGQALRLCPDALFVPPRMARYAQVSGQIREVFGRFSDRVEPLSLDEAYLDVSLSRASARFDDVSLSRASARFDDVGEKRLGEPSASRLAALIKQEIKQRTGLTASAGVGPCKLVAKIASDLRKPDGFVVVRPDQVLDFLAPLPVTRLWGVGPATAARLLAIGAKTIADVRGLDPALLSQRFGKYGAVLLRLAHGDDPRPVAQRERPKRRGSETTFAEDVLSLPALREVLSEQCAGVARALERAGLCARSVTLKLRYHDFTTITRSRSLVHATAASAGALFHVAEELLCSATQAGQRPVRLIGVAAGGLLSAAEPQQLRLEW